MTDKRVGDRCETCGGTQPPERLVKVNGALVCPRCDSVDLWPNVRNGTARIER